MIWAGREQGGRRGDGASDRTKRRRDVKGGSDNTKQAFRKGFFMVAFGVCDLGSRMRPPLVVLAPPQRHVQVEMGSKAKQQKAAGVVPQPPS